MNEKTIFGIELLMKKTSLSRDSSMNLKRWLRRIARSQKRACPKPITSQSTK